MERQLVNASYHQVFLAPMGSSPVFAAGGDPNGLLLVDPANHALIITTGLADGPVWLTVELASVPPSQPSTPPEEWESLAEVSSELGEPLLVFSPLWTPVRSPVLTPDRPGLHRVRATARGRSIQVDLRTSTPTEEFVITVWPESEARPPVSFDRVPPAQ